MRKIFEKILIIVTMVVVGLSPIASVSAKLSDAQDDFFAQNDITFYDPTSGCFSGSGTRNPNGSEAEFGLSATQVGFVEQYHEIAMMLSINYGIPWETVVAQGILESAAGTSSFAINRNNFFGIGAFDSNPNNAFSYPTPEEGWEGYYKNIQKTSTYRNHGVFSGDTVTDPYAYLVAIKTAGYATDPQYIEKVSKIIAAIEKMSQDRGWKSSAQLAQENPEWFANAAANAQGANISGETSSVPLSFCGADGKLVSGGMSLEEAQEFMQAYAAEASKHGTGNMYFQGAYVTDSGCSGGTLNNCSAFTAWFLNRYTTLGPNGAIVYQGSQTVKNNLNAHPELIDGGKIPRAYAIMSQGPLSGTAGGFGNHTGIVLGIDEPNNKIIIGEASCSLSYTPGAHEYSLSKYTNNPSQYGPTYAYTDNVLKLGE